MRKIYHANFINPKSDTKADYFENSLLVVEDSKIVEIVDYSNYTGETKDIVKLQDSDGLLTVMPAFCDTHFHWVQDPVSDMDKENLLAWLEQYVFPEERKFEDLDYAKAKAEFFFNKLKRSGTFYGAMYASIHDNSVVEAFNSSVGDFLIGNVVMTDNSPEFLKRDLSYYDGLLTNMYQKFGKNYVVTPRFALSCNPKIMTFLGDFAKKHDLYMQTHLSETINEINITRDYYQSFDQYKDKQYDYMDLYDDCGLVHEKAIFGHCIHLTDHELDLFESSKAKIAHCPTSNAPIKERGLGSGLLDYTVLDQRGIDWALASDIGAGPYISMFDVMKSFVDQHTAVGRDTDSVRALYRSTKHATEMLGMKSKGALDPEYSADFICLPSAKKSNAKDILDDILALPRDSFNELIVSAYYQGQKVF
ncbi:MAG: amidohydrolase family protein [Candidatus Cloacimonetes bacterium]|nr:amidohydrolase family protein [Candidatus Cloacimonadota bacterium]